MQLSVIILNYNVKHFLQLCIDSVQKAITSLDAEIIVVDNASSDGSKEMMISVFPHVKYIYLNENSGFPKGNNIGVAHAQGRYICILNPDTVVSEHTFTDLIEKYNSLQNPGILGCHLIDGSGQFLPESKRGVPTPWVAFTKVLSLYKIFPNHVWFNKYYAQNIKEYQEGKVDILVGAFMFLTKELYLIVGGFDEGCFMYSDDIDLSYLVLKESRINYYVPKISVIHFKGESTLKDGTYMNRFKEAMQFFYGKHFKKSVFFDVMMNIGIFLFALKKKSEKGNVKTIPSKYYLISNNPSVIKEVRNQGLNLHVFSSLNSIEPTKPNERIEFLVDSENISYTDYINLLIQNKNSNKTFKIRPQNSNYFIGSNDKNDKGEILLF